jgi:hypothetical protein
MFNEFKKGEYYEQTFQTLSFLTVIAILMTASGQAVQAGWEPGLPDQSLTTDHIHYWAIYNRFGVTGIYKSASSADRSATIQALIVNK